MNNYNKQLVLVNEFDQIIGTEKAIKAHLNATLKLHRAFSVFIFNSKGELLLQKRADEKLVFPGYWANSVCSHPFINELSFSDPILDCKIHAIKRIEYELGIKIAIGVDDLIYFDRFLYLANDKERCGHFMKEAVGTCEYKQYEPDSYQSVDGYRHEDFGEYEIDYLFYCVCDEIPVPNPSEVQDFMYVSYEGFKNVLEREKIGPWLKLICEHVDVYNKIRK